MKKQVDEIKDEVEAVVEPVINPVEFIKKEAQEKNQGMIC